MPSLVPSGFYVREDDYSIIPTEPESLGGSYPPYEEEEALTEDKKSFTTEPETKDIYEV